MKREEEIREDRKKTRRNKTRERKKKSKENIECSTIAASREKRKNGK